MSGHLLARRGVLSQAAGAHVYSDNFDVDDLAANWRVLGTDNVPADWAIAGGVITTNASANSIVYFKPDVTGGAADVAVSADVATLSMASDVGICLLVNSDPAHPTWAASGLMLRNPYRFGGFALYSVPDFGLLDNQAAGALPAGQLRLELEKVGNDVRMRTYADGVLQETKTFTLAGAQAAAYGAGIPARGGFRAWETPTVFDNLDVLAV